MQRIGDYWVPDVDVRGAKRRRKTLDAYEEGGHGRQITHLLEALQEVKEHEEVNAAEAAL